MSGVNYREFSAKIKSKYPQYANVDDLELAKKIVEKYPEYSDQVLFDEVPTDEESVRKAKEDVYGVSYKPEDAAPEDNRVPSADNLPETLSYKEEKKETVPNYFGLFDKKAVVDTANKLGVSVGFFDKVGEAASRAEYALEKLYEAFEIKRKAEALKKHFPEVAAEADSILSDLVGTSPNKLEDISARLNSLEGSVASYVEEQPTLQYRGYINDTYDDPLSMATKRMIENTKNLKKAATEDATTAGRIVRGTGKGIQQYVEGFTKIVQEMASNRAVVEINDKLGKVANGEDVKFTDQERMFLQIMVDNAKIQDEYGKRVGISYNIGEAFGQSLGFMAEFVMTGGLASGATKLGQGAKVVSKAVQIGRATKVGKVATNMAIKAAQAGVQTLGMPSFYQKVAVGVSNGETFGGALLDSYWQMWAENMSERIFMSKIVPGKEGANVLDRMLGRMGTTMTTEKGALGVLKSTLEESAEEKIGEILTAPKDFDNFSEFWKSFTDIEQNKIMLGSVSLMTGLMGSPAVALNAYDKVSTGIKVYQLKNVLDADITGGIDKIYSEKDLNAKDAMSLVFDLINGKIKQLPRDTNYPQVVSDALRYAKLKAKQTAMAGITEKEFNELINERKQPVAEPTAEVVEEAPELTEQQKQVDYLKSRGQVIPDGTDIETLNKMFSAEKTKERTEVNTEIDTKVKAAQEKLGLPQTPDIEISEDTEATLDRLDEGLPVTNEFIKAASRELYDRYKELEAMKTSDTRLYTTEQIESMQGYLGEEIERLESYAREQKETGEFVGEVKGGEVTKGKAEGVAEGVSEVVGEPQKPVWAVSKESGQVAPAEEKVAVKPSEEAEKGIKGKTGFESVPVFVSTAEEGKMAQAKVFDSVSNLEVGSVIENGDEVQIVIDNSVNKKGDHEVAIVIFERNEDGVLVQKSNPLLIVKKSDGTVRSDYNPHSVSTNDKGERTVSTATITGNKIDLSKEKVLVYESDSDSYVESMAFRNTGETSILEKSKDKEGKGVQVEKAVSVPVEPTPGVGEKVEGRAPGAKPEEVAGEKKEVAVKPKRQPTVSADDFIAKLKKKKKENPSKYWSVDVPTKKEIEDGTVIEVDGGRAIVSPDGNLIGVHAIDEGRKGIAAKIIEKAKTLGVKELNVYDGYLVKIYEKNGFREVARVPFNKEYAPKDMPESERKKKPDVVFMVYDPKAEMAIKARRFESSDEAKAYVDSYITEEPKVDHNKSSETQAFFSDVVTGKSEKYVPKRKWKPLLVFDEAQKKVLAIYEKFNGKFDEHIATSIPAFRDVQIKVISAILSLTKGKSALMYDIGGSEGGFAKTVTSMSNGKVKTINLDANNDMQNAHNATPVKGSEFVREAFGEGFDYDGVRYERHVPKKKADVVHESMTFQFIDEKRSDKLDELVANYLKPDGLFITEEKVHPKTKEQWDANEKVKDEQFKTQYYDESQIDKKREEVLTGMKKNQTTYERYRNELLKRFDYVEEYWDGGNFKGIVASNDKAKVDAFIASVGNTESIYSEKNISVEQLKEKKDEIQKEEKGLRDEKVNKRFRKISKQTGTDAKTVERMYNTLMDVFGLSQDKALAGAVIVDRMVGTMAKRTNKTKDQVYATIKWEKSTMEEVMKMFPLLQSTLWHGSPYQFDKFTTEKIGTGEGAQAFGWGLYFTELEGIARHYAKKLGKRNIIIDDSIKDNPLAYNLVDEYWEEYEEQGYSFKEFVDLFLTQGKEGIERAKSDISDVDNYVERLRQENLDEKAKFEKTKKSLADVESLDAPEETKDTLRKFFADEVKRMEGNIRDFNAGEAKKYLLGIYNKRLKENEEIYESAKFVKDNIDKYKKQRVVYKVTVHKGKTPDEYEWLEWDKEIADAQISKIEKIDKSVGEVLRNWSKNPSLAPASSRSSNITGDNVYRYLTSYFNSDKEASLFLLRAGIDGNKYPAESISGKPTRGFNFVVFDENAITIEEAIKFQQKVLGNARGAQVWKDAYAVIYALTDPNVTTPLHELAHVYEKYLTAKEKEQILKWTGEKSWSVNTSESFARGFERFLYDGTAPGNLKAIFQKFAAWLKDIYKSLVTSEINIALNEDMRRIYSTMLGSEYVEEKVSTAAPETAEEAADAFFGSAPVDEDGNIILSDEEIADEFFSGLEVDENGVIKFQFIGATGAARLDAAENNNNRIFNLREAMKMADANKTAEEIKLATGWEKGKDKRWRYEIPDNMKMRPAWDKLKVSDFNDKYELPITEAMDYPELFAAYPELEKIKIRKDTSFLDIFQSVQGWYDPDSMELVVAPHAVNPFGTVLHELQHAVQIAEGFATGTNSEEVIAAIPDFEFESVIGQLVKKLEGDVKRGIERNLKRSRVLSGLTSKEEEAIGRYSKEIIAARAEEDAIYNSEKKRFPDKNPYLENARIAELKNIKQGFRDKIGDIIERILGERDITLSTEFSYGIDAVEESIEATSERVIEDNKAVRAIKAGADRASIIKNFSPSLGDMAYNYYKRVAGETEARNVAARAKLTPEQRRSTAESTEDIPRAQQIVMRGGKVVSMDRVLFQEPKTKRDIAVDMLHGLIKNEKTVEAARARIDAYLTSRGIKLGVDGGNIISEAIARLGLSEEVVEAPVRPAPTKKGTPSGRVVAERPISGKVKESKLGIRVIDGESAMPQHIKNEIMAGNLHKYDVFPDEMADATAGELYRANGLDGSIAIFTSRENRLHAKLEVFLGAYIVEGINREISRAEKDGRIGDANYWATRMVNFTKDYIATVSVERAQGLAALNSARVQSLFPSRAFLMKYEMAVSETRDKAMDTRTFKRKVKQIKNDGNKAHKEVLNDVLEDLSKKLSSIKEGASLREMMKQKKALLDELKERRKNPPKMQIPIPSIPGLDPVDVAYGASIASVYIQAGVYGEKLVKGLVKDFKSIGVDITEEQAEKMVPSVINVGGVEVSVNDFLDELEGEKEAMRLANRIFGAITPKKETKDPLTMMLNTLMAKFNERNLNKPERKKVSDIEKIGEAIRDKEHYAETWAEARKIALDMIEANEDMDIDQKEIMSKMIDDAYDKATSFVFSEGQVDRAIRAKMKDMGMVLADIVRSHFDVQVRNRGSLTEAIIIDAGIDRADAEMLARAIERRYDSLMSEHGRRLIKKYTQHLTPTQKRSVGRRSNEERLLELINIGAFDDPSFVDAFASARGLVTLDPVHVRNIKAKAEEINKQKSRVLRLKKTEDLLGYMANLEGVSLAEIGDAVWYASVLSGMSTQVRNIMGGGAGVGINLATEMLWHPSYVPAMLRGIWRGVKFGKEKAEDVLKYGYSPYETRVETPRVVERLKLNPKAFRISAIAHVFNNLKYVSRFMAAADMFNVSVGKEAWAELLALEHLKLNDKKVSGLDYIFDSKYRKQVRSAINTFLGVTKEQIDAITAEVEADAVELGYTETDKKIAIIEGIEMIRPGALVEVSTTMAVKSTGNTRTYGMIGFITDRLADVMKGVALPFPEKTKTGEIALGVIHPFKYVAAFTKIVSNVGALALEYVPFAAMPRYVSGAAGAAFKPGGSLSKIMPMYGKYYHELSETERKAVLHRQIVGMVFTAVMVMLSDPGDDDDPIIQITADGTGDWNKNNSLKDWKPYSLGIKVGDKRVWVPFRYTPLILALAPIGWARDRMKYSEKHKDAPLASMLTRGYTYMPSFLADMTAIQSMNEMLNNLFTSKFTAKIANVFEPEEGIERTQMDKFKSDISSILMDVVGSFRTTLEGFYTPGVYRDMVKIWENLTQKELEMPANELKKLWARNPVSVLDLSPEGIVYRDVLGRPTTRPWFLSEFLSVTDKEDIMSYHTDNAEPLGGVDMKRSTLPIYEGGKLVIRKINPSDAKDAELWDYYVERRGYYLLRGTSISEEQLLGIEALKAHGVTGEEYQKAVTKLDGYAKKAAKDDVMWMSQFDLNYIRSQRGR